MQTRYTKIRANLKRHNRVYILSSKHTYRPMRACVVAQLFYNVPWRTDHHYCEHVECWMAEKLPN